jgi:hypothetical protein
MVGKRVIFTVPEELLMSPILYNITSRYGLESAVYKSEMTDKKGIFELEFKGEEKQIEEGLAWAMSEGIDVKRIK